MLWLYYYLVYKSINKYLFIGRNSGKGTLKYGELYVVAWRKVRNNPQKGTLKYGKVYVKVWELTVNSTHYRGSVPKGTLKYGKFVIWNLLHVSFYYTLFEAVYIKLYANLWLK